MLIWEETETPERYPFAQYQIIRRNGAVVPFEPAKRGFSFVSAVLIGGRLKKSIPALDGLRCYSRQRLGTINLKQIFNGFFSATKANLRNAP